MAIPNPNPNIEDGKKCDNKTYSSNKIESLIKTATELPIPEAGDAGKVLTVNSDSDGYELDNVGGIPSIESGDAGKVITVNAGETAYELATPVTPESIIDDTAAAADSVYSSSKVDTLLSNKVSKSVSALITDTLDVAMNANSGMTHRSIDVLAIVSCIFNATSNVTSNTQIAHLEGLSQTGQVFISCNGSAGTSGRFKIENGKVYPEFAMPAGEYFSLSFVTFIS